MAMRVRILQSVGGVAIVLLSMLSPLWVDRSMTTLTRAGASVAALRDLSFHGTAFADDADNSVGGDNNDDDNSTADNADNSSGDDNSDNSSGSDNSDNSHNGDNADNSDSDNGDSADNADNSDSNDAADNGGSDEDLDNVSAPPPSAAAPAPAAPAATSPSAAAGSETQASGTSTGGDSTIALAGDRVVVQVFPWMPAGVTITIRLMDPATAPPPPGTRAGNLIFRVEAQDVSGAPLTTLPAEVNLGVRYADQDVAGLNKQNATLVWLDPVDTRWKPATKPAADPSTNYLAASVTALGTYAVSVP
jgi:hypothetical protein